MVSLDQMSPEVRKRVEVMMAEQGELGSSMSDRPAKPQGKPRAKRTDGPAPTHNGLVGANQIAYASMVEARRAHWYFENYGSNWIAHPLLHTVAGTYKADFMTIGPDDFIVEDVKPYRGQRKTEVVRALRAFINDHPHYKARIVYEIKKGVWEEDWVE